MISLKESHITDVLPQWMGYDIEIRALSYAISQSFMRWQDRILCARIASVNTLPESVLDERAKELNTPYYDSDLDIKLKRSLVKNTISLYRKAGTRSAVEEMVKIVFGSGAISEWYEHDGEPGTFRIETTANPTTDILETFTTLLKKVKNVSASLESISQGRRLDAETEYIAMAAVYAIRITIK